MKLLEFLISNYPELDERTARGLILRGDVLVDEVPVTSAAAEAKTDKIRIRGEFRRQPSRGRFKLQPILETAGFNCADKVCLDLGAANGGFTSVLLDAGARRVYAVDVAYGILADELRQDPRVVVLERTNARKLTTELIPEKVDRVVGDLSFISWRAVLPAICELNTDKAEMLLLVKPQFELAAAGTDKALVAGVVIENQVTADCLAGLHETWQNGGVSVIGVYPAAITGRMGNQEYFVHLVNDAGSVGYSRYLEMINNAIGDGLK